MWNIFITMSTVGYGDVYAMSHLGRLIAVMCGFWGVFLLSLFILSLMNMLNHNSSEMKAYNLLQRLLYKDDMKRQAVNMLSAAFKIQKIRKTDPNPSINTINELQRYYKQSSDQFNAMRKNLRNSSDYQADMDTIKMSVDSINYDISLIRKCIPSSYKSILENPKSIIKEEENEDEN